MHSNTGRNLRIPTQEDLNSILHCVKKTKLSIRDACQKTGIDMGTVNSHEPVFYLHLKNISRKRFKKRIAGWRAVNMAYRFYNMGYTHKELADIYPISECYISQAIDYGRKHIDVKYHKESRAAYIGAKTESYWESEDDVLFKPTTHRKLSYEEKRIYAKILYGEIDVPPLG